MCLFISIKGKEEEEYVLLLELELEIGKIYFDLI